MDGTDGLSTYGSTHPLALSSVWSPERGLGLPAAVIVDAVAPNVGSHGADAGACAQWGKASLLP